MRWKPYFESKGSDSFDQGILSIDFDRLITRSGGGSAAANVNRDIPDLLKQGGFAIDSLETMYPPGTPRFGGFNYWGTARVG